MTITITQLSVHGANGAPAAGEDLTAYAELTNDAAEPAAVEVTVAIDNQDMGTSHAQVPAVGSEWVQVPLGHLSSGGHDIALRGAVDDGTSSSEVHDGNSFQVAAPPAPTATLGELTIRAHSNVEHPVGQAWTDERIGVWVEITNTGSAQLHTSVSITNDSGHGGSHDVTLAPNQQQWLQQDFDALVVGTHTFTAQATAETENQSAILAHTQGTLTVTAANAGYAHCNVQLALRDFQGRPMGGRAAFVQFLGMDGTVADGAETVQGTATTGGVLTLPQVMMSPRGSMRVTAVSTGEAEQLVEGVVPYHLAEHQTDLQFTAEQDHADVRVTATDMQGVRNQLSSEVSAGVEIEVISIGGKVATADETSRQHSEAVEWVVRIGRPSFTFTVSN
jgi:hypothetical protein